MLVLFSSIEPARWILEVSVALIFDTAAHTGRRENILLPSRALVVVASSRRSSGEDVFGRRYMDGLFIPAALPRFVDGGSLRHDVRRRVSERALPRVEVKSRHQAEQHGGPNWNNEDQPPGNSVGGKS